MAKRMLKGRAYEQGRADGYLRGYDVATARAESLVPDERAEVEALYRDIIANPGKHPEIEAMTRLMMGEGGA